MVRERAGEQDRDMTSTTSAPPLDRGRERRFPPLTAAVSARTWREFGYLWLVLLLAAPALAYVVLVPSLAAGLAVTVVGLFLVGGLVVGARGWGSLYRRLARSLLGTDVDAPAPYARPRAFWPAYGSMLTDAAGWRALLFMLVSFPLGIFAAVTSTTVLAAGLGGVSHPAWVRWLPLHEAPDGTLHRASFIGDFYFDSPVGQVVMVVGGLLLLLLWPWTTRALAHLFRLLTLLLLAPTRGDRREARLRRTRDDAVEDADARLRRIERDLHDGTQARLVAVAMQLGEAREQLSTGGDTTLVAQLLDDAHDWTKATLTELREIARGIHPAALDAGLAVALETLASRSPVPVALDVDAGLESDRPLAPAVQSIAYYTVAELLTNVAKHAGASRVEVTATRTSGRLWLSVRDDGHGGAEAVRAAGHERTGLAGLADRLATVEGTLDVSSPAGGPTVVTATIPVHTA